MTRRSYHLYPNDSEQMEVLRAVLGKSISEIHAKPHGLLTDFYTGTLERKDTCTSVETRD